MSSQGNFVAEWLGHRVYPGITHHPQALADQSAGRCPFLSAATGEERACIKAPSAFGVCTISSPSNGRRQDWLVCPYRAVEPSLVGDVVDRLFGRTGSQPIIVPAPKLLDEEVRTEILMATAAGGTAVVFLQDKLGGEISLSRTERSPEFSFDITLAEIRRSEAAVLDVARYGILEVQTMDFHGSYRYAVQNLRDALRLHDDGFPEAVEKNPRWLCEKIEGPNIANVFKRTFYQIMLKFQVGSQGACAGSVLALPRSVWDSWQRHLGAPELDLRPDGNFELKRPGTESGAHPPAWIYVFDLEQRPGVSPDPLVIEKRIATDTDSLAYYALKVAPEAALGSGGMAGAIPLAIKRRLAQWWPQLWTT